MKKDRNKHRKSEKLDLSLTFIMSVFVTHKMLVIASYNYNGLCLIIITFDYHLFFVTLGLIFSWLERNVKKLLEIIVFVVFMFHVIRMYKV